MVFFIDTDPGTDDIMALIYLLEQFNDRIIGLSSVFGNVNIDITTRNLRLIAGYFKKTHNLHIDVFQGFAKPIINVKDDDAAFVHGADGCGDFFSGYYYTNHKSEITEMIESVQLSDLSAVHGLIEMSKKYCGELVVVALGPLTNLALAQIIDPMFGSRLKEVFIMGGDLHGYGNCDVHTSAEFNFNKDPEAVYVVLKEIQCKKTILPLEPNFPLAIETNISENWLEKLESKQDFLANIKSSIIKFRSKSNRVFKLYDLMLAFIIVDSDIVSKMETVNVTVELTGKYTRGKLVYDHQDKSSVHHPGEFNLVCVVSRLDSEAVFMKMEKFIQ